MSQPTPPGGEQSQVDAAVLAFDAALQADPSAEIGPFLPDGPGRLAALVGMVRSSIERAWRLPVPAAPADRADSPAWVEYHLARYPELLAHPALVIELLAVERACAPAVPIESYVIRFPALAAEIRRGLGGALPAIPGFEIRRLLGRGTTGVVYLAWQPHLRREVALKLLTLGEYADEECRTRLRNEAHVIAGLEHPNVVKLFDAGEHERVPYLVLEHCPGGSLKDRLAAGPLRPCDAARLLATLARTMRLAHERGVIHRDLKPANILFGSDGEPRVGDFGLARLRDETAGLTPTLASVGTPAYAAPEQAGGAAPTGAVVTPAADVYALGAILYECLTGRLPFPGGSAIAVLHAKLTSDPAPLRQMEPSLPRDLETICLTCLNRDPARRYPGADALADDLDRFLAGEPIRARPPGPAERLVRWCGRNRALAALVAVLVIALVTTSGLLVRTEALRQAERDARTEAEDHYRTSLGLLADYTRLTSDHRLARRAQRDVLERAAAVYDDLAERRPADPDLALVRAEAYALLTERAQGYGEFRVVLDLAVRCDALVGEPILADPPDPAQRLRLADVLERLVVAGSCPGGAALADRAATWADRARVLRQPAVAAGDRRAAVADLRTDLHLAVALRGRQQYAEAIRRLERCEAGFRDYRAAAPECPAGRDGHLESLILLAEAYRHDGNREAERRCWQAVAGPARARVEANPGDPRPLHQWLAIQGRLAEATGTALPADEWHRQAKTAVRLWHVWKDVDPACYVIARRLVDLYEMIASAHESAGEPSAALPWFEAATQLLTDRVSQFPDDAPCRLRLLDLLARSAWLARAAENEARAAELFRRTAQEAVRLLRQPNADPAVREWACRAVSGITAGLRNAGRRDEAREVTDAAIALLSDLVEEQPDLPLWREGLSEAWTQLAKTLWREGDHARTEQALRRAADEARILAGRSRDHDGLLDDRLRRLGRFLAERGQFRAVAACLDERARLAAADPLRAGWVARDYRALAVQATEPDLRKHWERQADRLAPPG